MTRSECRTTSTIISIRHDRVLLTMFRASRMMVPPAMTNQCLPVQSIGRVVFHPETTIRTTAAAEPGIQGQTQMTQMITTTATTTIITEARTIAWVALRHHYLKMDLQNLERILSMYSHLNFPSRPPFHAQTDRRSSPVSRRAFPDPIHSRNRRRLRTRALGIHQDRTLSQIQVRGPLRQRIPVCHQRKTYPRRKHHGSRQSIPYLVKGRIQYLHSPLRHPIPLDSFNLHHRRLLRR